ncbi:hypothetical protein [Methylorubrum sp. SL192]|uniref:hypothetical protein n=1 Tax=Methylorubrum sp. SL192 TaxID=2995167 RepID=UPI002272CDAA|nr:hypothetical protein [Methylorubrum sp. SL192]MCY1644028.1 hypothetical protein [Methylorubrum sp. SL192]
MALLDHSTNPLQMSVVSTDAPHPPAATNNCVNPEDITLSQIMKEPDLKERAWLMYVSNLQPICEVHRAALASVAEAGPIGIVVSSRLTNAPNNSAKNSRRRETKQQQIKREIVEALACAHRL